MRPMSRAIQRNTVSAGLGLGLAELGQSRLPGEWTAFNPAFRVVWERWTYRNRFPEFYGPAREWPVREPWELVLVYDKRKERPLSPLYWGEGADGMPELKLRHAMDDLDPTWEEYAHYLVGSIPGRAWVNLARMSIDQIEDPDPR